MSEQNLSALFKGAISSVMADAKAAGIPMTKLCDRAGVSRATLYRMRRKAPTPVAMADDLRTALEGLKAER